ncbi:MAG: ABC transporter permease [Actinobacteria bacterium]|nr:ABC transporter permease [Actinomycetota bacterium]
MGRYVLRRLVLTAATVVAVSFLAFLAFSPLDPTGPMVLDTTPHGHAARQFVLAHYHLKDDPVSRWWHWATGVLHHGFGNTVSTDVAAGFPIRLRSEGQPIGPTLWHSMGITAALVGGALLLVLIGSSLLGTSSARRQRFRMDVSWRFLAYLGAAVPTFLIGDLLQRSLVGAASQTDVWLENGPPQGGAVDWVRHLTVPAVALALGLIGVYARFLRSSVIVELGQPYVVVARAKGLSERRVVHRHALRAALAPLVSLLSLEMGAVLGASLAADGVFHSGGLASTFLAALGDADPFELTAIVTVAAVLVCLFSFAGEALAGALDPRIGRA